MTDIRARLANAIAAELEIRRGTVETWGAHIADVLLSLPGIAIVELPEPYPDETVHQYWAPEPGQQIGVADIGIVRIEATARWRSVDVPTARAHAAALLAAANAAEDDQ
jgi:hypothetical protein